MPVGTAMADGRRGGTTWCAAAVPGTIAGALYDAGRLPSDDTVAEYLENSDVWYRTIITTEVAGSSIRFEGVATACEVSVDGVLAATHQNMYTPFEVPVGRPGDHELFVVCRSLVGIEVPSRPRARWRTQLAVGQHLRWFRTSLLGRMPGWAPPYPPVGPWRSVKIIEPKRWTVRRQIVYGDLSPDGVERPGMAENASIVVDVVLEASRSDQVSVSAAFLVVGGTRGELAVEHREMTVCLTGRIMVPDVKAWWPATHGAPALHDWSIELIDTAGAGASAATGRLGFRTVRVERADDSFAVVLNDVRLFCRGTCWMPLDPLRLNVDRRGLEIELSRLVRAGINMVRVPGTTVYESDDFYDLCDELGILVWQDVMLANYDYPSEDAEFHRELENEIAALAGRLASRPSVVVLCGGSEVEQQAAMTGMPVETWRTKLAHETLAALAEEHFSASIYVTGSPSGRPFPFSPGSGVAHYFGVGAYLRTFDDARRANVRFATECLAFAGVPSPASVEADFPEVSTGDWERWDDSVVRDRGAVWDFQDVRDHYVQALFHVDPKELRRQDGPRYLDLGRAAVYECIHATLSEWRRSGSSCAGALVLQLHDVQAGAGWGIVDHARRPKSGFYALADASAPCAVLLTDEGLNGLWAHVVNDATDQIADASLSAVAYGPDGRVVAEGFAAVEIPPRSGRSMSVDELFGGFRDVTYAYRFGEPFADVVEVCLRSRGAVIHVAHYVPRGLSRPAESDLDLSAQVIASAEGWVEVEVSAARFAQYVRFDLVGIWLPDSEWFHIAPAQTRKVRCRGIGPFLGGSVQAINAAGTPVGIAL